MSEHFPYDQAGPSYGAATPPPSGPDWIYPQAPANPYAYGPPTQTYAPYPPPDRRTRRASRGTVAFALVAAGALAGAGIGHAVWGGDGVSSSSAASSGLSPLGAPGGAGSSGSGSGSGSGSTVTPDSGSGSSGSSSSTGTGPSDAAAIAKTVSAGLVDINTTLGYQNAEAAGTGMVLTSDGEVLTNNHVIAGATAISVRDVGNGKTYAATVVGYDVSHDVAVLKLTNASGLTTVTTAKSQPKVGAAVVGIGNAGGTGGDPSYAGGSIVATGQSITASDEGSGTSETLTGLLETDADIQAGDSGGPLVDASGAVVGMDTAASAGFQFQSRSQSSSNTEGFAIPIQDALSIVKQIESGTATTSVHIGSTALLGVGIESASQGSSAGGFGGSFGGDGTGSTSGAVIASVVAGGPAGSAGLVAGDVITAIDGHSITDANGVSQAVLAAKPGQTVSVGYVDNSGQQQTATVTLASGPPQ